MNFGQLKICVEKHSEKFSEKLTSLKNSKIQNFQNYNSLKAALLNEYIWGKKSDQKDIKIGFLKGSETVERHSYDDIKNLYGNGVYIDPLQKEVDKLSVIDGIKKIVTDRYIPILGNINISFVDDINQANVRIGFDGNDGAWSYVGTECLDYKDVSQPTMNLGWFDVQTVLHEFGHLFGMIHEHNNPRGNSIDWNKNAVYTWARETQGWDKETTDSNIMEKYSFSQTNGSDFDPLSIMLYFFPGYLTLNGQGTKENLILSGYDVLYLTKNYPSGSQAPNDFYVKTYGTSIKDSINKSDKLRLKTGENNNNGINKKYIIIGIVILLIIIVVVFVVLFLKK